MAILSNINGKFAVESTGAIQFNGSNGTSGYVLKSNGNASPTWVDPDTIIGPYLPLSGGTLTGATSTASGISFTVGGTLTVETGINLESGVLIIKNATSDSNGLRIFQDSSDASKIYNNYNGTLQFGVGNTTAITIDSSEDTTFAGDLYVPNKLIHVSDINTWIQFETDVISLRTGGTDRLTLTNTSATFSGNVQVTGALKDSSGDAGTSGQILSSTATGTNWIDNDTGDISGSGTANTVAKFTGTKTIGDGPITFSTNNATCSGTVTSNNYMSVESTGGAYIRFKHSTGGLNYVGSSESLASGFGDENDMLNYSVSGKWGVYTNSALALTLDESQNATFAGQVGLGGTGIYTNSASLNIDGLGLAIKNTINGSNNNWSLIKNTATASTSNLVFISGAGTAVTINHDKSVTFEGNITISKATPFITLSNTAEDECGIVMLDSADAGQSAKITYDAGSSNALIFYNNATNERMRIHSNGRVSIGSTTASANTLTLSGAAVELDINNTSGKRWRFNADTSGNLRFEDKTGGTEVMRLATTGNVGIGTTSPAYKLDVAEKIRIVAGMVITATTSNLYAADGTLSYYGASNAVYLNGAGPNGWLRLNGAGSENDRNSINIYGSAGDYMNFRTANSERMRITSGGNVGIGTTSPNKTLTVYGGNDNGIWIDSQGAQYTSLAFGHNGTEKANIAWDNTNGYTNITTYSNGHLAMSTGGGIKAFLNSSGNFGIGTTSPLYKTQINVAGNGETALAFMNSSVTSDGGGSTNIRFVSATNAQWANASFSAYNYSFYGNGSERVTILGSSGNVGIGTTSPNGKLNISNGGANGLEIDPTQSSGSVTLLQSYNRSSSAYTTIRFNTSSYQFQIADTTKMSLNSSGTLTVAGDVVAYGSPSDISLKENIKPIKNPLGKIKKLKGITFDWKKSESILDIKEDYGFIAQDVQKVIPELVRKNENELLSMRHQGIIPILVEAIKELEARVKELENK